MSIDAPLAPDRASKQAPPEPPVALRVVTTYAGTTRRLDVVLGGVESALVEETAAGTTTRAFPSARLWPVLRDELPPLDLLRARPTGRAAPPARRPGPSFADDCLAHVSIATVVADTVTVRTWLVDDTTLWSVEPRPDGTNDVRPASAGALGDLLVWDVTAALELVTRASQPTDDPQGGAS